jgi:lipopolysaccharide transport system permease protein
VRAVYETAHVVPHTVIEPLSGWRLVDVAELWRHRDLLYFFTWRDVKIRYKQTFLGVLWALLQPFLMMVVFSVFFGKMAKVDYGDNPAPVFLYAGLLPWTFFANAISNAGNSVVGAQQMITKIYFPRLLVPFAAIGAAVVDFLIAFTLLLALMVYYRVPPGWPILAVPALLVLASLAAAGVGTLLAALNVAFRDFKYTMPFLVQIWMFATPAVYLPDRRPSSPLLATIVDLNPMNGLIAFFRAATLGGELPWAGLVPSTAMILVMFFVGVFYFRRVEANFADVI